MTLWLHISQRKAEQNPGKPAFSPVVRGTMSLGSVAMIAKDREGFAAAGCELPSDRLGYSLGRPPSS